MVLASILAVTAAATHAEARDRILIVGSSTVFPFSTAVAERFGAVSGFKTPVVESTGSGGGIKLFCAGAGASTPDITNASRRMKPSELETCLTNGVTPSEVVIGFDGIVLANSRSGPEFKLTRAQIFQALADEVPSNGQMIKNPYKRWSDINPVLPDAKIEVLGPPPTSGTRDAFEELVMEQGCEDLNVSDSSKCTQFRTDGLFLEAGENDELIVRQLGSNPVAVGIFGFSFVDQNKALIQSAVIEGVAPTFDNIAGGSYPVSRSLYFYVKTEHHGEIPGLDAYIAEFTSENALGDDGYLASIGLIPLPDEDRENLADKALALEPLRF
ncbi:substrate-binding domain-containing protein [Roseibium hamelinense]|nr:substrate-binding domain-containing protein [Roseibium hamelinense]